jgi:7-keto-8-aminopelargonate synthetase-like enzyme
MQSARCGYFDGVLFIVLIFIKNNKIFSTFTKSFGAAGGYLAGNKVYISHLIMVVNNK